MAKKRIAADVDLCGNSVENVKNVTASGTVKADTLEGALKGEMLEPAHNGKAVAALPYYTYIDLGLTSSATNDEYIQALLKKLVSDHGDLLGKTLIGITRPGSRRNVILYTYPTEVQNDMPRHCSGVMYTGYNGGVYRFWINNGVFGGKTIVNTTGDLIGARTDHNGNTIATTYATKSEVNNKVTKNNPDGVIAYEGNLKFGTGSVAGSVNPLDMALISECGANRFAFIPPKCITIEYSRDAGATWLDYGASDRLKVRLVSNYYSDFIVLGKSSTDNPATSDCRLRVTIKTQSDITKMYSTIRKFAMRVATVSQQNCWCTIKARTMANIEADADVWMTAADKAKISGDSGNNVININSLTTYSWNKANYGEIQFIFGSDADAVDREGLRIYNIFAYGENAWGFPSEMAKTGHLYSYDYAQNATFPNGVTAKSFTGNLEGTAKKATQDAKGNTIDTTYAKTSDFAKLQQTVGGHSTAISGHNDQIASVTDRTKALEDKTVDMRVDASGESYYGGRVINDEDGNVIKNTYAHGVSIYDDTGDFVETAKAIENGYLKLQDSEDIQVNQYQDSEGKKTIGFSLTAEAEEKMGARRVIAYGVPDSSGKIAPEDRDVIFQDNLHALNVISSDSIYVDAASATLDIDPQQSVEGMKMSVRLAPNGGLESTSNGLKVKQLSDGFYSAPKLILSTNEDADGKIALYIDHPCWGTSGVEFVLMNKSRRTRGGIDAGGYNHKTKDRKRGWTVAMNYRRAAMSYDIARDELTPCVLGDSLTNCDVIFQYVQKYYMYPFNVSSTDIDTTNIALTSLYFGGWNMTKCRKYTKVFGIAARRLKSDGKYEYSQPAAIKITKIERDTLAIGIL